MWHRSAVAALNPELFEQWYAWVQAINDQATFIFIPGQFDARFHRSDGEIASYARQNRRLYRRR